MDLSALDDGNGKQSRSGVEEARWGLSWEPGLVAYVAIIHLTIAKAFYSVETQVVMSKRAGWEVVEETGGVLHFSSTGHKVTGL